jgi:hypothetical protein
MVAGCLVSWLRKLIANVATVNEADRYEHAAKKP